MSNLKNNLILFLGMSLLMMLSFFYTQSLLDAKDVIIFDKLGPIAIPYLKSLILPVTLAAGVIMIALSWNGRVNRAFNVYFPLNTIILALFAWLLHTNSPLISNPHAIHFFYIWASLSISLTIVMIWGLANQIYPLKTAAIQYPIFGLMYYSLFNSFPKEILYKSLNSQAGILGFAALASLLIFFISFALNRMHSGKQGEDKFVPIGYWVALGFLIAATKMAAVIPEGGIKLWARSYLNSAHAASEFMLQFSITKANWTLAAGFASIIMGYILYVKGFKALRAMVALIIAGMLLSGLSFYYMLQSGHISKETMIESLVSLPIMIGFFTAFKIFKEFLFFNIESNHRFSAKLAFDFMASSFTQTIGSLIMSGVFINVGLHSLTFTALTAAGLACLYMLKKEPLKA